MSDFNSFEKVQAELKRPIGLFSKPDRWVAALIDLQSQLPQFGIRGASPLLKHRSRAISSAAETAFELALAQIDEQQFDRERELGSWAWEGASLARINSMDVVEHRNLMRLCTCNPNGYVREKALRRLGETPQAGDWPFVLDRLNDWVPEVRHTAAEVSGLLVASGEIKSLVRWPRRVSSLVRWQWTTLGFEPIARALAASGQLASNWSSYDRNFCRAAIRLLVSEGALPSNIIGKVLKDNDVVAIKLLLDGGILSEEDTQRLFNHWSPGARKAALEALLKVESGDQMHVLLDVLFDPFVRVRKTSHWHLKKLGIDPRPLYLQRMDEEITDRATIEGFCEVATLEDLDRLRTVLRTSSVRGRFAAAKTLLKLGDETELHSMLHDPSGRVRKVAVTHVLHNPLTLDSDQRLELLNSPDIGLRRTGLVLLMGQGRWVSIQWILRHLDDPDIVMRNLAFEALRRWLWWASHSPTIPTTQAFGQVWSLFENLGDSVSAKWKDDLGSILRWIGERVEPA